MKKIFFLIFILIFTSCSNNFIENKKTGSGKIQKQNNKIEKQKPKNEDKKDKNNNENMDISLDKVKEYRDIANIFEVLNSNK